MSRYLDQNNRVGNLNWYISSTHSLFRGSADLKELVPMLSASHITGLQHFPDPTCSQRRRGHIDLVTPSQAVSRLILFTFLSQVWISFGPILELIGANVGIHHFVHDHRPVITACNGHNKPSDWPKSTDGISRGDHIQSFLPFRL